MINDKGQLTHFNFSEVGITNGLVAYYPFDKDARDYSGNGNHGIVSGAVLSSGIKGQGYTFDGVDDMVYTSSSPILTSFTFSAWIYIKAYEGTTYRDGIVSNRNASDGLGVQLVLGGVLEPGYKKLEIFEAGGGILIGSTELNLNTWYHVVGVANSTNLSIYLNGNLDAIGTGSWTSNTSGFKIGNVYTGIPYYFNGIIDEVRIYNRALSAEEVSILYETTAPSTAAMKITKDTVYLKGEFKEVI